jgi:hypothetical protein
LTAALLMYALVSLSLTFLVASVTLGDKIGHDRCFVPLDAAVPTFSRELHKT